MAYSESDSSDSEQHNSLLQNMSPKKTTGTGVFASQVGMMNNMAFIRNVILIALLAQNSGYTLLRKLSTSTEAVSSREILLVGELIKFVVSAVIVVNSNEPSSSVGTGLSKLMWVISNSKKMMVLAGIYLAMNVLSFVSLTYIGAGEFSVCAQLKILTTAGCSVLVLNTKLSATKWRALGQLVVGCILVISPSLELQQKNADGGETSQFSVLVFGYGAVLMEVMLSGFASIYFEKVVKSTTEVVTIWERNMQLSFYSIIIYLCMISYDCSFSETPKALGENWSGLTMMVAFLGAFGGLLVAATLKYADSILKTLATAGAIVVSTVLGHFLLDSPLNHIMALGATCVIFAIFNYTMDATPPAAPTEPSPILELPSNKKKGSDSISCA
jgi:UDP-sugar transporter A1/2/3